MAKGTSHYTKENHYYVDAYEIIDGLHLFDAYVYERVHSHLEKGADEMVRYAQANRPWTDRTTAARQNIHAETIEKSGMGFMSGTANMGISLSHGVSYGGYLEEGTSHARPYPIIGPTVERYGQRILDGMQGLLGSAKLK